MLESRLNPPSTESGSVPALPFQAWVHWCGKEDHPDPSSSLFGRLLERGGYEYPPDVAGELVGRAHWDVHGAWLVLTIFAWLQFLMVTVTVLANLYWIPVSIVFEKLNHFSLEKQTHFDSLMFQWWMPWTDFSLNGVPTILVKWHMLQTSA